MMNWTINRNDLTPWLIIGYTEDNQPILGKIRGTITDQNGKPIESTDKGIKNKIDNLKVNILTTVRPSFVENEDKHTVTFDVRHLINKKKD